ncbi:hypothetical protein EG328_003301 [Venturia inaequalis]|uniref:Uncharacterized protein n=1 Tax=Venturia inaequalis TaxID=5025 RepID=A0A8H3VHN9_VENIN|nr:hypothetical protein EG327_008013 [Venturia inaequalis]KAE9988985.1 hypothetical protein EG328_003301 [Venturia inaequalis]
MALPSIRDAVITGLLGFVCMADTVRGYSMSGTVTYVTWTYNASSTTPKTVDIKTNGTGTAYAFACAAATPSYSRAQSAFLENRTTAFFPTFTTSHQYTTEFWDTYTVDCQNITHARGTTPLSSYVYYNTTTFKNYTSTADYTYPVPPPSCSIAPDDCKAVQSSYSKESAAFTKFTSAFTPPYYVVNSPASPSCSTACTAKPQCMIKGDHVKVIYWPVTTTGANSCRSNGTTVPPTATGLRTIEALGTTFTSPSVYLSFQSLSAYDWGCYRQIGQGISNTIIAIPPESLSSAVGWHLGRSAVSYNLADLNGYVSSKAYFNQQAYDWSGPGKIIYDDRYFPSVWMPDAVLTMRPEWSTCAISQFGIPDPPVALQSVELLTPEAPVPTPVPNTATPVAGPSNADPPKTTTPALQDQDPSRGQDSPQGNPPVTKSDPGTSGGQGSPQENPPAANPAGNGILPPGPPPPSATPSANIGDVIASVLGFSRPDPQPADVVTITTVKIISIVGNGFVDGTKTMPVSELLPDVQTPDPLSFNYLPHTDNSGSTYVMIEGAPVYAGSSIVIGSHTVSVDSTGIVVDGTRTVPFATAPASGPTQASDYQVIATTDPAGNTVVVVGNQTLSVSGAAMTIDGHTLSAESNGIVVDGNATTIPYVPVTGTDNANGTFTTSSPPSITMSTDSVHAAPPAAPSKTSSSASQPRPSRSSTALYLIFGIGIAYCLG